MENLKQVNLENLTDDQIIEHKENILKLDQDSIIEYLSYAFDTYYSLDDNQENNASVEKFFDSEEFRPFYTIMLQDVRIVLYGTEEAKLKSNRKNMLKCDCNCDNDCDNDCDCDDDCK